MACGEPGGKLAYCVAGGLSCGLVIANVANNLPNAMAWCVVLMAYKKIEPSERRNGVI